MNTAIFEIFMRENAALAPLAGVSSSVFRRICREFGARPVMTEMISSEGLLYRGEIDKSMRLLSFCEEERPVGFQFFGADPAVMAAAVQRSLVLKPDFIDINAGCPVRKVIAKGAGSALMKTPEVLAEIVRRVCDVATVPVTVKIRAGWDHDSINAVEVASMCADAGASGIIVHPRTRSQGFSGVSDWSVIGAVKKAVSVPVIGSGDIRSAEDAFTMLETTGADSVMIGRKAMGNPWIFRQVNERLTGREVSPAPTTTERLELALKQLDTIASEISERFAILNMRKFFGWYSRGARDGSQFRQTVFRAETIDEVRRIVRDFISVSGNETEPDENDYNDIDTHEMAEP